MPAAPHQFRVTKYSPAHRAGDGSYLLEDWTSHADVGKSFNGVVLTEDLYKSVEHAYLNAALAFLQEAQISRLTVVGLENHRESTGVPANGDVLSLDDIPRVLSEILSERYWCKLESEQAFVHVGYDYYMYVGVPVACPDAQEFAEKTSLFVEPLLSPYLEDAA